MPKYVLENSEINELLQSKLERNHWYCYLRRSVSTGNSDAFLVASFVMTDANGIVKPAWKDQKHFMIYCENDDWKILDDEVKPIENKLIPNISKQLNNNSPGIVSKVKDFLRKLIFKEPSPKSLENNIFSFSLLTDKGVEEISVFGLDQIKATVKQLPAWYKQKQHGIFRKHDKRVGDLVKAVSEEKTMEGCLNKLESYLINIYNQWKEKMASRKASPESFLNYINNQPFDHHSTRLVMLMLRQIYSKNLIQNINQDNPILSLLKNVKNEIIISNKVGIFLSDKSDDALKEMGITTEIKVPGSKKKAS